MKPEFWEWNAERYLELNDYFRIRIKLLLESDPYLQELISAREGLQLSHITDRMTQQDQEMWLEFMRLDEAKFYRDIQNHLEGRGTPYNSRTGFGKSTSAENEDQTTW
ncbi:hypothetical protein I5M27_07050 [Adhaeribacter sp. BT258]|uniref:Uncharacterized protein n=1 Tax=Adhaeribacter terrigena TaxID=2793070 RepID=A0ABS1C027_9BACT|nr:hypothetical protein [Adhaeribacter terrigena]MBK0402737.1 hypothetical protein [Adhaeribacter terrigena]